MNTTRRLALCPECSGRGNTCPTCNGQGALTVQAAKIARMKHDARAAPRIG